MKVIESSARGRGGRGGGRGGGSSVGRGRGRGGGGNTPRQQQGGYHRQHQSGPQSQQQQKKRDPRFAARKTDPRFKASENDDDDEEEDHTAAGGGDDRLAKALASDPRFRRSQLDSRGRALKPVDGSVDEDEEDEEEEYEGDEDLEEGEEEEMEEVDAEELALLDEDAAGWSGSDVEEIEATHRVAVVNCDWDHIRAEDIFSIFFHNLPLGGKLESVKLYLSDFGREQLEHEKLHGPNLWVKKNDPGFEEAAEENRKFLEQKQELASAYAEEYGEKGLEGTEDFWEDEDITMLTNNKNKKKGSTAVDGEAEENEGPSGENFSSGKYRQYELNRMKYYYAIAEFDSAETAKAVYGMCDGVDIEASGVNLDLRYVPEEETFENDAEKTVSKIPPKFRPTQAFKSAALSQTRFQISWDQDDFMRSQAVQDVFVGDTAEDDLAAYIASSESENEEDDEANRMAIRSKYAALLKGVVDLDDTKLPPKKDSKLGTENEEDELPAEDNAEMDEEEEFDEDEEFGDDEADEEGEDEEEDDDDLNRFSDVEFDVDEEAEEGEEDGEGMTGNMEATFDINEEDKASKLQRDLQRAMALKNADMATRDALKYKLKRKEGKAAKKAMLKEQREMEIAEEKAKEADTRKALKAALGESAVETEPKKSGRLMRKELGKAAREREMEQRKQLKRNRLLAASGIDATAVRQAPATTHKVGGEAKAAAAKEENILDSRFDNRLVSDPRFHLDVATRGRGGGKQDKALTEAAAAVAKARRQPTTAKKAPGGGGAAPGGKGAKTDRPMETKNDVEDEVNYFLSRPSKKRRM